MAGSRWVQTAGRLIAAGRVAVGVALVVAPEPVGRVWLGESDDRGRDAVMRGLGARDVVLGMGALLALRDDDVAEAVRWLDAAIVADLADAGGTAALGRPTRERTLVIGVALGAAGLGGLVRSRLR